MKILVKNIEANPHRAIGKYPIDKAKVEALKTSIKNTSFWDNILVRFHPTKKGKYQLAYGHHRLVAIKALSIKEIDVPARKLDEAMMIKIMAEENLGWSQTPAVMIQTIDSVRKFLDAELAKCKTYDGLGRLNLTYLFKSEPEFRSVKGKSIGKYTIAKFLGGNWNESKVHGALEVLDDKNLSREAISKLPKMYNVGVFQKAIKVNKVPKAEQEKIADAIIEKDIGGRDIPKIVEAFADKKLASEVIDLLDSVEAIEDFRNAVEVGSIPKAKQNKIAVEIAKNPGCSITATVLQLSRSKSKAKVEDPDIVKVKNTVEKICKLADGLFIEIGCLESMMEDLSVTDLSGCDTHLAGAALERCYGRMSQIIAAGKNLVKANYS